MTQERVTVKIACDTLGVSRKTLYRYLEKGLLSRVKEGRRIYIPMDDIRALRKKKVTSESQKKSVIDTDKVTHMSLSTGEYRALVKENEELKAKTHLLLEYKGTKDREVQELRQSLKEVQAELGRLKKNPFRRIVENVLKKNKD